MCFFWYPRRSAFSTENLVFRGFWKKIFSSKYNAKIFNPPWVALFKLKNPFSEFFHWFFYADSRHETLVSSCGASGHRVAAFARSPIAERIASYADRSSSADSGDRPPLADSTFKTISNRFPASDTLSIMSYTWPIPNFRILAKSPL